MHATIALAIAKLFGFALGETVLLMVLAASASYIAVPAAMKIAAPKSNPGLFIPMALAITFPINITIGMPLFYFIITNI